MRVNAVAPGIIESPTAAANYKVDNVFNEVKEHLPSKRAGVPDEIASAVCFLLSPGASFISGTTLKVDCGSSLYTRLYWNIGGKSGNHLLLIICTNCSCLIYFNLCRKLIFL